MSMDKKLVIFVLNGRNPIYQMCRQRIHASLPTKDEIVFFFFNTEDHSNTHLQYMWKKYIVVNHSA